MIEPLQDGAEARIGATLALALAKGESRGLPPTTLELDALRTGSLDEPRRGEVLSHLAWNPAEFQRWLELEAAEAHLRRLEQNSHQPGPAEALALLLAEPPLSLGTPPELWEVEQWRLGRLAEPRASQVRAHLAWNPAAFADLQELENAEPYLQQLEAVSQEKQSPSLGQRLWAWLRLHRDRADWRRWEAGLTTVSLVLLIAVWVRTVSSPPWGPAIDQGYTRWDSSRRLLAEDWPWWPAVSRGLPTKGETANQLPPTPERLAFRQGIRQGLERLIDQDPGWAPVREALPESPPLCPSGDRPCEQRRSVYQAAGRWAVLLYWQCRRQGVEPQFWVSQEQIRQQLLQSLDALEEQTPLAEELRAWRGETPQALLCGGIADLLDTGLADREK